MYSMKSVFINDLLEQNFVMIDRLISIDIN